MLRSINWLTHLARRRLPLEHIRQSLNTLAVRIRSGNSIALNAGHLKDRNGPEISSAAAG